MIIAVLDIGSNTSKVLLVENNLSREFQVVGQKSLPLRLANFTSREHNFLPLESMVNIFNVIQDLIDYALGYKPDKFSVVGTEALRKISNSKDLCIAVKERFGLQLRILSGAEEASGVVEGLLTDPNIASLSQFCAIDLGGGSLEVVKVVDGNCEKKVSLPLGAVVLARKYFKDLHEKPSLENIDQLVKEVNSELSRNCTDILSSTTSLVGTGGAVVYLRKIIGIENGDNFDGECTIKLSDVQSIERKIISTNLDERIELFPNLPMDRADIFPAAVVVILQIMKFAKADKITHSFHNLRYGIARQVLVN
jgi:exopolyphosphatase/guanosine-5'-triphosphate,3'-diphosphate pyrophosphatase